MSITVLVIPHAGGMASAYYEFSKYADSYIDFRFAELSGRGSRIGDELYRNFDEAVEDLFEENKDLFREGSYVLFGHSMGSWLAYELYYKILSSGLPLPLHIFFSGNVSPFTERTVHSIEMSDDEFIEYVLKNEQTSRAVFTNPELRAIFLPVLRADYSMLERYMPEPERAPMQCSISVLCGMQDPLLRNGVSEWEELTARECEITYFDGSHFYLFDCMPEIFDYIYRNVEMCYNI